MRAIAILLIFCAILAGIVWPWAQANFLGREVTTLQFGDLRGPVVERQTFNVTQADNPVRIRFQASYKEFARHAMYIPMNKIPVKVVITDRDGTLLTGRISFSTRGIEPGPEQAKVSGSQALNFGVINDGEHELYLELVPHPDNDKLVWSDIDGVAAKVVANAPTINDDYKPLAAVMVLAGFYLLVRSRKQKNSDDGKIDPPPRWGRRE